MWKFMKIKNTKTIDLREWDKFVVETYKRPYSFQQQDGCRSRGVYDLTVPCDYAEDFTNDSVPEEINGDKMGVSFKAWLERDSKQKIINQEFDYELELWWERNFYPSIEVVANDLHKKGLLEAGEYTIIIDW